MNKEIARLLVRVLRVVYNRLDDVGVSYGPTPPLTGLCDQQRYQIEVKMSDEESTLLSEWDVLVEIERWTD